MPARARCALLVNGVDVAAPEFDIVVIGGGSGGLVVAAGGSTLGAKVALVERHKLGGRKVAPRLTQRGVTLTAEVHGAWEQAQRDLTHELGAKTADAIRGHLSSLRKTVRALETVAKQPAPPPDGASS